MNIKKLSSLLIIFACFSGPIFAATDGINDQQLLYQQEREKALESQLVPEAPEVRLAEEIDDTPDFTGKLTFPKESLCFTINEVLLTGIDKLPQWLPLQHLADQAKGRCMGSKSINMLMSLLQNRLMAHGYVTTRVVAPSQDLNTGILHLHIVEGVVRNIRYVDGSDTYARLYPAIPLKSGDLLDLRALEQGLENMQQIPTAEALVALYPGDEPGESDILVSRRQEKFWRLSATVDDNGMKSTGRYQGNLALSLDNPTSLSDMLYTSIGHDLDETGSHGSKNYGFYYTVPIGYWSFSSSYSRNHYRQVISGLQAKPVYSGESRNIFFQVSRLLHRNDKQKTSAYYSVFKRDSHNYLNDVEIGIQRRDTAAWEIGLNHRHYIKRATINLGISYQRGTRWFGAQPAPEEAIGYATALSKILHYHGSLTLPFLIKDKGFYYRFNYQRQMSNTPLTPQDRFAIGGRWSVRGFDGEYYLSGSDGWYVRNELGWWLPDGRHSLYVGADYGEVGGTGSENLSGKHLAGSVLGVRGGFWQFSYDCFIAAPLSKPEGFKTDNPTFGFNVYWSY